MRPQDTFVITDDDLENVALEWMDERADDDTQAELVIEAGDGDVAMTASRDGDHLVLRREPPIACPDCSGPVERRIVVDADNRPQWSFFKCTNATCRYAARDRDFYVR
jgi:hypothetical protein